MNNNNHVFDDPMMNYQDRNRTNVNTKQINEIRCESYVNVSDVHASWTRNGSTSSITTSCAGLHSELTLLNG